MTTRKLKGPFQGHYATVDMVKEIWQSAPNEGFDKTIAIYILLLSPILWAIITPAGILGWIWVKISQWDEN